MTEGILVRLSHVPSHTKHFDVACLLFLTLIAVAIGKFDLFIINFVINAEQFRELMLHVNRLKDHFNLNEICRLDQIKLHKSVIAEALAETRDLLLSKDVLHYLVTLVRKIHTTRHHIRSNYAESYWLRQDHRITILL